VIYPDPVSEELIVSNVHNINMIEIFDITGKKIISTKTEATDNCKITVAYLSRGLYLLRITTSEGVQTMRFVKS